MGVDIELVSVEDIDERWPLIVERVVSCLRKVPSDFSAGDVWTRCRSGNWFLFIAWDGGQAIGFSIWHFTANGYLACALLAGRGMAAWLPQTIGLACQIGKANGCLGLAATGRPGFIKALKKQLPQTRIERATYVAAF